MNPHPFATDLSLCSQPLNALGSLQPWLPLLCLVLVFAIAPARPASAAAADPIWASGAVSVFAIQDRPGEMPVSIFSGPASAEQRQKYFPGGVAEASINVFLITMNGRNILVDTGYGTVAPGKSGLLPRLAEMGLQPDSIDTVLLTHMHIDHVGGLLKHKQRAFPKAKILVSKPEIDFWLAEAKGDAKNDNAALVSKVVEAYGQDVSTPFAFGDEVLPGVRALSATGHTPGHTVFLIDVEGKKLLILGDLVHAAALQFPMPEECASYDMDRDQAVKSRVKFFEMAASGNIPVAGMHIPFPGNGTVKKEEKGFAFTKLR